MAADTVNAFVSGKLDTLIEAVEKTNWLVIGHKIGEFIADLDWGTIMGKAGHLMIDGLGAAACVAIGSMNKAPLETALYLWLASAAGSLSLANITKNLVKNLKSAIESIYLGKITLDSLVISFKNILPVFMGTASFDVFAQELFGHLNRALQQLLPDWAFEFLSNVGAGLALGAVAGSWFPGAGTVAGAIIGGITGALNGIKIDGISILKVIGDKIFNFDTTKYFLKKRKRVLMQHSMRRHLAKLEKIF